MEELDALVTSACHMKVKGGLADIYGKVNVLLQSMISRERITSFSLISDAAYVDQVCVLFSCFV
jgi:activating signal cointegrator complex subunit 3